MITNLAVIAEGDTSTFQDLNVPASAWLILVTAIVALLGVDLWRHSEAHQPSFREAATESALWVLCGLGFSLYIVVQFSTAAASEFLGVYLTEKSLSIDNVFVWALLFSAMGVPGKYQHRVLFWGIFGALTLRAIFIFAGAALVMRFSWILTVFGIALIGSGIRIMRHDDNDAKESPQHGTALLRRLIPVSSEYDGQRFFTTSNGVRMATPLLAALVVVEVTDIFFAIDSVPASFGVSNDPYIILAANAFAIAGLRAMYFLLADARDRFRYLSHALGAILFAVGIKLVVSPWYHVNSYVSLGAIVVILVAAVGVSLYKGQPDAPAPAPEVVATPE